MGKQAQKKKQRNTHNIAILQLYQQLAGPILLSRFSPDCCLNGTRIALDVLSYLGLKMRAVVCDTLVFNRIWWEKMEAKGDTPTPQEADEWVKEGAWSLGVSGDSGEISSGYPWHLVAVGQGYLVDSAAAQFRRPDKHIITSSVIVVPAADFPMNKEPLVLSNESGTVLIYKVVPNMTSHEHISGFQRSPWNVEIAEKLITLIEIALNQKR